MGRVGGEISLDISVSHLLPAERPSTDVFGGEKLKRSSYDPQQISSIFIPDFNAPCEIAYV